MLCYAVLCQTYCSVTSILKNLRKQECNLVYILTFFVRSLFWFWSIMAKYYQDMPPSGGYGPINWARKIPKAGLSGYAIFGITSVISGLAWAHHFYHKRIQMRELVEMNDARFAITPLMMAEEQRAFLKQLRKNRDEENEIMKNVPGWETGKWKGEPVWHNVNGRFPVIHPEEYYAHNRYADMFDRYYEFRKH